MDQAKAKEVFSDEAFVASLFKLDTPEEVQKALKTKGLEASLDEILAFRRIIEKAIEKGGELSEDELEKVAGGFSAPFIAWGPIAIGLVAGAAGTAAIATQHFLRSRW
jgi:hypothetical protein